MGGLYQIEFTNGKSYIGITKTTVKKRLTAHLRNANKNLRDCALHNALRKYPDDYILKTLVIADDWNYLCLIEQRAIKTFGTRTPFGYNMTDGGEGTVGSHHNKGLIRSEETKRKLSISKTGVKQSEETIKKRIAATTGRKRSEEYKKQQSLRMLGNKIGCGCKGNKIPKEVRAKISTTLKGNTPWNVGKTGIYSQDVLEKISNSLRGNKNASGPHFKKEKQ